MTDASMAECLVIPHRRTPLQWVYACDAITTLAGLEGLAQRVTAQGQMDDARDAFERRRKQIGGRG